jgi:hypothetical protein
MSSGGAGLAVGEGEGLGDGLAVGEGVGLGEAVRVGEGEGGALSPTVPQPLSKTANNARQAAAIAPLLLAKPWLVGFGTGIRACAIAISEQARPFE